jgi:alpha/beta superfamily hydrolase
MTSVPTLTAADERPENSALRAVTLDGPSGRLEALLNEGSEEAPYAALVCHPHPLGGGTMHNKVAYHAMKVLNAPEWGLRWPVLRFNFRGTGLSEGEHHGMAEAGDVVVALDWLADRFKKPLVVVGFSFGAAMALCASCDSYSGAPLRVPLRALAALGLPIHGFGLRFDYPFLSGCTLPKLFLSGDRDPFASSAELKRLADQAADPKKMVLIPGANHSFSGQLDAMQRALAGWLKEQVQ